MSTTIYMYDVAIQLEGKELQDWNLYVMFGHACQQNYKPDNASQSQNGLLKTFKFNKVQEPVKSSSKFATKGHFKIIHYSRQNNPSSLWRSRGRSQHLETILRLPIQATNYNNTRFKLVQNCIFSFQSSLKVLCYAKGSVKKVFFSWV